MIFVKVENGLPVKVAEKLTSEQHQDPTWQSRWDWKDFETVSRLSKYITAMTGKIYLPTDATESTAPRYDIIEAPAVGDPVSYGFNGDYYPCGYITKITKGWRVTTSEGKVFNRRPNGRSWRMVGGTWGMVAGHISEQNPHF
jgi:hypothetical protein